jgi:DNA (cytosine-5)-methyltransferase 1
MVSVLGGYTYEFPKEQPLTLRLKDMLEAKVDEKYYLTNDKIQAISQWKAQQDPLENMENIDKSGISPTLTARGAGEEHSGMVLVKENIFKSKDKRLPEMLDKIDYKTEEPQALDLYNRTVHSVMPTLTLPNHNSSAIVVGETKLIVDMNIANNGRENGNIYNQEGLSPTLLARDYKDPKKVNVSETKEIVIGSTQKNAFVGSTNGHAPSLTSAMGAGGGHTPMIANNLRIRKLTPKECYRLMGFSDEAFDKAQANQSNSALYHQAGDSIVVNVLMAIFKEML